MNILFFNDPKTNGFNFFFQFQKICNFGCHSPPPPAVRSGSPSCPMAKVLLMDTHACQPLAKCRPPSHGRARGAHRRHAAPTLAGWACTSLLPWSCCLHRPATHLLQWVARCCGLWAECLAGRTEDHTTAHFTLAHLHHTICVHVSKNRGKTQTHRRTVRDVFIHAFTHTHIHAHKPGRRLMTPRGNGLEWGRMRCKEIKKNEKKVPLCHLKLSV